MFKKFLHCTPHLPVKNLQDTFVYYRQLGFGNDWTFGSRDGGLSRDDLHLLFEENPEQVAKINTESGRLPLVLFVNNVEQVYQEFLSRKVALADTLREHPYGVKEFAFIDINGYYIRIAEKINATDAPVNP